MESKQLTNEYYKNFDVDIFYKKLSTLVKKIQTLKTEKSKKVYYTELYATYLQIVEIFCINSFAISDKDLLSNVFMGNTAIEKKIRSRFYSEKDEKDRTFVEYLIDEFVFNLLEDTKDRTPQKKYYKKLTEEAIDDYLKDKHFLNSYKHGFRVFSGEKTTLSIGLTGSKNHAKIADYSSSVSYYKKEDGAVYKCEVCFNWERVYVKAVVLLNVIENMKRTCLYDTEQKVQFITFDTKVINSKYGCFRVCSPLT